MDRRNALQTIGATVAAGALGGHARAAESLPVALRGVCLELHDLKRGLYALNPYSGELERLSGRRARVELDGDAHVTCGMWVAADEAAGTVTVLQLQERLPRGVCRFIPDPRPDAPYHGLAKILRGRVEIYYRWKGQNNYERLHGPVAPCAEASALQKRLIKADYARAQETAARQACRLGPFLP